jgi:hypothetical protein
MALTIESRNDAGSPTPRPYPQVMERIEVPVSPAMRDRLIEVASQRGMSVEELLVSLIGPPETLEELRARAQKTHDYIKEHLCPEIDDLEGPTGRELWAAYREGRLTSL